MRVKCPYIAFYTCSDGRQGRATNVWICLNTWYWYRYWYWWVGSRGAEFYLGPNMDSDSGKRTSASAAPDPSASAAPLPPIPPASAKPNTPASATPLASARPHIPAPADTRPTREGRVSDSMFRGGGELPASPTPRILIISCETKKLSSLSPFQRKEGCDRLGKVTRCDKLRDGGIEVEFLDEKDAKKALSATEFTYSVRRSRQTPGKAPYRCLSASN